MKLKITREKIDNDILHLALTGDMTVYTTPKLKDILLKELRACSGIIMNLTDVDEADTSGFQLLIFLRREAGISGKSFKITGVNNRLQSIFSLYKEMI